MYNNSDLKFDVVAAVEQLHWVAAPSAPEFAEGARLMFEVCGWAYLYAYARRFGGGGTARRMAENVAEAAADFQRWVLRAANGPEAAGCTAGAVADAAGKTPVTNCRKGEAGENGAR